MRFDSHREKRSAVTFGAERKFFQIEDLITIVLRNMELFLIFYVHLCFLPNAIYVYLIKILQIFNFEIYLYLIV